MRGDTEWTRISPNDARMRTYRKVPEMKLVKRLARIELLEQLYCDVAPRTVARLRPEHEGALALANELGVGEPPRP